MELQLKEILQKKGITMSELAARTGIMQANISNLYHGKISPNLSTIERIATALAIPVADLLKTKDVDGYLKYRGTIYEIDNLSDLEQLISTIKAGNP